MIVAQVVYQLFDYFFIIIPDCTYLNKFDSVLRYYTVYILFIRVGRRPLF